MRAVPLVVELLVTGDMIADSRYGLVGVVVTMLGYVTLGCGYARRYLGRLPARVPSTHGLGLVLGTTLVALALGLAGLLTPADVEIASLCLFEPYTDYRLFCWRWPVSRCW